MSYNKQFFLYFPHILSVVNLKNNYFITFFSFHNNYFTLQLRHWCYWNVAYNFWYLWCCSDNISFTFIWSLQDWQRRISPQAYIRVFLHSRPLLCCWKHRAGFSWHGPKWPLTVVSPQLSVLRFQLLDFIAHLQDDVRQAAAARHGAAAALPVPRLPKNRRVVQEKLTVLLGF